MTSYEQDAIEYMQLPAFIAACDVYVTRVTAIREQMRSGKRPTQRTMTELSRLEAAMRETTGLKPYKKTWKIIAGKIAQSLNN